MHKTIFFVGLSHKYDKHGDILPAFSPETASGKLIESIVRDITDYNSHLGNLVKTVPLDERGKIRYPKMILETLQKL